MTLHLIIIIIKCLAAILVGIFAGNGAVYFFNKMPAHWLCDYGETPGPELMDEYTQRVKSYPWKYIFTMGFVVLGIKLVVSDWQFAIAAECAIWLLLEMAIADIKYRIVPDQLIILLAVSALGFIPFHFSWTDCLFGGALGFGVMFAVALVGKLVYRKETLGGGDIKLFTSLGFVAGFKGIILIFIMTTLISAGHFIYLLLRKKIKRSDSVAMVPYISLSAVIYIVFLWGVTDIIYL